MTKLKKIIYYDKSSIFSGAEKSLISLMQGIEGFETFILFNYPQAHHKNFSNFLKIYRNFKLRFWMGTDYSLKNLPGTDFLKRIIFAIQLFFIFKKIKPDVFHLNLYRNSDFLDIKVANLCKVKCVVHVRSLLSQVDIDLKKIKNADYIIATSKFVKNEVLSLDKKLKVEYVYNPLNLNTKKLNNEIVLSDQNTLKGIINENMILSSIGILDERKGHDTAIEVAVELNKKIKDFKLLIVGGDLEKNKEEYDRLNDLIRINNIHDKVIFLGHVSSIDYVYSISHFILALSKDGEAFGRVPLEAAIHEKVVIATCMGATPEIIENMKTGFLVDPFDSSSVVEIIIELINDPVLLKEIGKSAFNRVTSHFSVEIHCKQISEIYNKLLTS